MVMNTNDRHMLSSFRGAPVMTPTAGTLIAALDAFLITGYGHITVQSAVIAGGVCTATVNAGENFEVAGVILISGATPAGLNGVARVTANTATTVSWPTSLPDGPVTGMVGIRYAPVPGWEKAFTKTNVAVYRSTHPASSGMYLRIDDSAGASASVRAYKMMTDVDTGTEPFPAETRLANPLWFKTYTGAAAKPYAFWGDRSFLIIGLGSSNDATVVQLCCFGDPIAIAPAGDSWCCLLGCQYNISDTSGFLWNGYTAVNSGTTSGGVFVCRSSAGSSPPIALTVRSFSATASGTHSGADGLVGAYAGALDGRAVMSELFVTESTVTVGGPPRAVIPGLRHVPQTGFTQSTGQRIPLQDGGVALAVAIGTYVSRAGTSLFELGVGRE